MILRQYPRYLQEISKELFVHQAGSMQKAKKDATRKGHRLSEWKNSDRVEEGGVRCFCTACKASVWVSAQGEIKSSYLLQKACTKR